MPYAITKPVPLYVSDEFWLPGIVQEFSVRCRTFSRPVYGNIADVLPIPGERLNAKPKLLWHNPRL
jgi:hypothetical protein